MKTRADTTAPPRGSLTAFEMETFGLLNDLLEAERGGPVSAEELWAEQMQAVMTGLGEMTFYPTQEGLVD